MSLLSFLYIRKTPFGQGLITFDICNLAQAITKWGHLCSLSESVAKHTCYFLSPECQWHVRKGSFKWWRNKKVWWLLIIILSGTNIKATGEVLVLAKLSFFWSFTSWFQTFILLLRPLDQDIMLTVNVSANHRYIQVCTCHRLHTTLTFVQNVQYQVHITCLLPEFYVTRWRVGVKWGWCLQFESMFLAFVNVKLPTWPHKRDKAVTDNGWMDSTWEVRWSPAVFVVTKTDVLSQTTLLS